MFLLDQVAVTYIFFVKGLHVSVNYLDLSYSGVMHVSDSLRFLSLQPSVRSSITTATRVFKKTL